MNDLRCAPCLRAGDRNAPAITITNGEAVCYRHFQRPDRGTVRVNSPRPGGTE